MLSWSVRRRLIYLAIALIVVAIAVVATFIALQKPPSCSDGKQNQDELGVDCGGSCPGVCITEITPLKILWYRLFDLGPGKYDVAALVKNPNLKHGATEIKYIFRLWDKDNLLINSKTGTAFANPKEDLIIFASRVDVGKKIPVRISFELEDSPLWQKIDRVPPQLIFSNKRFANEPTPRLVATVKNDSITTLSGVEVYAILSDADQNAVAVSSTFLEELPGGESREVSFTWPSPFQKDVSFIDLATHFDWRKLPAPQVP
jgi:hypothetical protein